MQSPAHAASVSGPFADRQAAVKKLVNFPGLHLDAEGMAVVAQFTDVGELVLFVAGFRDTHRAAKRAAIPTRWHPSAPDSAC